MNKAERDIAETAYWFRSFDRYGTESKALKALLKRKSMVGCDVDKLASRFRAMVQLHDKTLEHSKSVLRNAKRSFHPQLTKAQFDDGTERIRNHLVQEFSDVPDSIEYMIAMLWHMPYVR